MGAGAMVERLLVQQKSTTTDSQLGRAVAWVTLDSVPAERLEETGGESVSAARVGADTSYRFRIRARADITPKMRALWVPAWPSGSARRVLEIHAVLPDRLDRGLQVLACSDHDGVTV